MIILAYLRQERVMGQMLEYMHRQHGISANAVRTQVWRLKEAGKIERVERGRYRRNEPQ